MEANFYTKDSLIRPSYPFIKVIFDNQDYLMFHNKRAIRNEYKKRFNGKINKDKDFIDLIKEMYPNTYKINKMLKNRFYSLYVRGRSGRD